MSKTNRSFLVHKTELNNTKWSSNEVSEIEDGDVLFKVDKYAFTSNNITYAVVGFKIRYWEFFPAEEPFGIVPIWGFAEVVASKHDGVKVGERFYGYYPMSDYLKVKVGKNNPFGFFDEAEHRVDLPKIYNYYINTSNDISYQKEKEDFAPIFRPLFTTSFLNYHFLKDANFFDASQILITSASSKTGLGLAFILKQNQETDGKKIIGLTSPRNVEFVKSTGYYDEVIAYPDLEKELPNNTSTIVDMAGNSKLLFKASDVLGENLKFVSLIGLTDWTAEKEFKTLPKSKFFFAPSQAQVMYKNWGVEKTNVEVAKGLAKFVADAAKWMTFVHIDEAEKLSNLYDEMLKGKVDPSKGYLVQL